MIRRPPQIENLLKLSRPLLKEAERDEDKIRRFIERARASQKDAENRDISAYSRFTIAYEAIHSLAIAMLTHFSVRTDAAEGHRQTALQILLEVTDLKNKIAGSYKTLMDAHKQRNRLSYDDPDPSPTAAEADAMLALLVAALPLTESLIALPPAPGAAAESRSPP